MTPDERALALALAHCLFRTSSSADRRFCCDLGKLISAGKEVALTEGQRAYLWRIAYRYRLQLVLHLPPRLAWRVERSQARSFHRYRPRRAPDTESGEPHLRHDSTSQRRSAMKRASARPSAMAPTTKPPSTAVWTASRT